MLSYRFFLAGLLSIIITGCTLQKAEAPVPVPPKEIVLTRQQIIQTLSSRVALGERFSLEWDKPKQEELLETFKGELAAAANGYLPESLSAPSEEIYQAVLPRAIIVTQNDKTYNDLFLQLVMRKLKIDLAVASRIRPLTPGSAAAIEKNVNELSDSLLKLMMAKLSDLVHEDDAKQYLEALSKEALARMGNPADPACKVPLDAKAMKELLAKIAARADASQATYHLWMERALTLKRSTVPRIVDPIEEAKEKFELTEAVRHSVCVDLCGKAFGDLQQLTTQPEMRGLKMETFDPTFPDLLTRLQAREEDLFDIRMRDVSEQHGQELHNHQH